MVNVTVSTAGIQGPPGNTVRHGTGAPASSLGVTGDWYIDTTTPTALVMYGPKTLTGWGTGTPFGGAGGVQLGADIGGTLNAPQVTGTHLAAPLPLAQGGTGLATGAGPGTTLTGTSGPAASWASSLTGGWVFNTATRGAVGDGRYVTDGAMGSGSAVLTSASAEFSNVTVGMPVLVLHAGASGVTSLVTTAASKQSNGQVTLAAANASGGAVTGALVLWGTDDTAAIQQTINDALAFAKVYGPAKVFSPVGSGSFNVIAGPLVTGGSTLGNSQLTLGAPVATTGNKVVLDIEGVGNGSGLQHWQQLSPQFNGSTWVSFGVFATPTAQASSITASGNPCVLGGPAQPGGYGVAPGVFSNMLVTLKNLSILTTHSAYGLTYSAADFSGIAEANLESFAYGTAGSVAGGDYNSPSTFATGLSIGLLMPANGNNDNNHIRNLSCHGGYTYALFATEHTVIDRLCILYCWSALCLVGSYFGSVGSVHGVNVVQASIEACTNIVYVMGAGSAGLGPWLYATISTESGAPTFSGKDATSMNAALGEVTLTGEFTVAGITVSNPTGLKVRNGQSAYPVTAVTANYAVTVLDDTVLVDATAGPVTVTLISAAWTPNSYTVKKIDGSANAVTVATTGGQTIDGAATLVLTSPQQSATVIPARVASAWNWYTT